VITIFTQPITVLLLVFFCLSPAGAMAGDLPRLQEVYQLLRANLPGISEEELDGAAVRGLISQLPSRTLLVAEANESAGSAEGTAPVSKVATFDAAFAYIRVGRVEKGLPEQLLASYEALQHTNKLKGLVIDLRFAGGNDYRAAAAVADRFLNSERPLLDWGEGAVRSTVKNDAILLPVAILVNRETSGAAEALAALLRDSHVGLIIGTNTAGLANIYKEFTLADGQRLRVASAGVQVGNDKPISADGVKPDIHVRTDLESEKAYLEDAYRALPRPGETASSTSESETNQIAAANRAPRRRINEAELVRLQREGLSPDYDPLAPQEAAAPAPQVTDPALNRALDLLKGLAVVHKTRQG
jgi:hypothetical protein